MIFATHNPNKLREVNEIIGTRFRLLSLADVGFIDDIPEPHETLHENALEKARILYRKFNANVIAEDTGLETDALNGQPGVRTARYAGEDKSPQANMQLLLQQLEGCTQRTAQFRTVFALILNGNEYCFEGILRGTIAYQVLGEGGFGYDPIFIPEGYQKTFAQMSSTEKNNISHRAKAAKQLADFLEKQVNI